MNLKDYPMPARYEDLKNKSVYISGGASGIGKDLVIYFAKQGANVLFVDIQKDVGQELAKELNEKLVEEIDTDTKVIFKHVDITHHDDFKNSILEANALGDGLYCMLNNAAVDQRINFEDVSPEDFMRIININLQPQFHGCQIAYDLMRDKKIGSIINFGSVASTLKIKDIEIYSACKIGVHALTRSFASSFGASNIRVNTLVPGCILTPKQLKLWITPEDEIDILNKQSLHRRLEGKDVAQMALFLASEASSACTGQEFIVDGGIT